MRWPLQPSQRNSLRKIIISSQIVITSIYSLFNRCLEWNDHQGRPKTKEVIIIVKRKSSSHSKQRLYLYILFLYPYFSQLFYPWNITSICRPSNNMLIFTYNHLYIRINALHILSQTPTGEYRHERILQNSH